MTYDFDTSYPAFKEPGKDRCREIVLSAIRTLGVCCDKQIAEYLGWEINRVTGRRGELLIEDKIVCVGKWKSGKRTVNWWKVKIVVKQAQLF